MKNILSSFWKPATSPPEGKVENLIGKIGKAYTGWGIIIKHVQARAEAMGGFVITDTSGGVWLLDQIKWLDESDEEVNELLKSLYVSDRALTSTPFVEQSFSDNGEHSHWNLIDSETGRLLWTEAEDDFKRLIKEQQTTTDNGQE